VAMFTSSAKTSGYSFSSLSITALNATGSLMPCATKLETLLEIIFATLLISVVIVLFRFALASLAATETSYQFPE